ncbi:hypothetical protein ACCUM_1111 [Candidatus Accumulibacter phosphatis]|uniref:Uncharacterized protein n=1 Tax=Candidatus Accumulibacter phosphatis TaxID=327160 RepID=A0A5S4ESV1_9PROT|nr:hypothetical protein ACCUM_1111 [Candidatus Accumulibacter phosphatis]
MKVAPATHDFTSPLAEGSWNKEMIMTFMIEARESHAR